MENNKKIRGKNIAYLLGDKKANITIIIITIARIICKTSL